MTRGDAFHKGQEIERARNLEIVKQAIKRCESLLPEKTNEDLMMYTGVMCALIMCRGILCDIEEERKEK